MNNKKNNVFLQKAQNALLTYKKQSESSLHIPLYKNRLSKKTNTEDFQFHGDKKFRLYDKSFKSVISLCVMFNAWSFFIV